MKITIVHLFDKRLLCCYSSQATIQTRFWKTVVRTVRVSFIIENPKMLRSVHQKLEIIKSKIHFYHPVARYVYKTFRTRLAFY